MEEGLQVQVVPEARFGHKSETVDAFLEAAKQEHGAISQPVSAVLERVLCDAEDSCPCSIGDVLEPQYLADLLQDLRDLGSETQNIVSPFDHIYSEGTASYYPRLDMTGSSLCVFPDRSISEKVATFISNTSLAYKGTRRETNTSSSSLSYRVSVISSDSELAGAPEVQPIDFSNEMEYWSFISALSRACTCAANTQEQKDFYWRGCGMVHKADNDDLKSDIVKFLSGASGASHSVEISADKLIVMSGKTTTLEVSLAHVVALALACDWPSPQEYVLEIDIQGEHHVNAGINLALLDNNLEVLVNPQYYHKITTVTGGDDIVESTRILIPLTISDLEAERTPQGLSSIAVVHTEGTDMSVIAVDAVPFVTFKTYPQGKAASGDGENQQPPSFTPVLYQATINNVHMDANPSHKACEVHIIGARDIPGELSTYCAVYLVDREGEKINARGNGVSRMFANTEEGEWKTDIIKGQSSPTWDTKLILQEDGDVGIDSVASVRIVVKEGGNFRFRKPRHLGQVTIPIGCFIDNTPVPLMLPLELTERMGGESAENLGVLHVMTQAVTIKNGHVEGLGAAGAASVVKPINRGRAGSVGGVESVDNVPIQYTLKAASADALNVYWPFVVLGGGLAGTSGYVLWGKDSLVVQVSHGAGGVLANCAERKIHTDDRAVAGLKAVNYFPIAWSEVDEVSPLTASVLKIRVIVHKMGGLSESGSRSSFIRRGLAKDASPGMPVKASVELLIAPCPSKLLQLGAEERRAMWGARNDMSKHQQRMVDYRESKVSGSSDASAKNALQTSRTLLNNLGEGIEPKKCEVRPERLLPAMVNVVAGSGPSYGGGNRWSKRDETDRNGDTRKNSKITTGGGTLVVNTELKSIVSPIQYSVYDEALVAARSRIRRELYRAQLLHISRGLTGHTKQSNTGRGGRGRSATLSMRQMLTDDGDGGPAFEAPEFTITGVNSLLMREKDEILLKAANFSANLSTELFELHSMIIHSAQHRILDYIICSEDADDPSEVKFCIKELLLGYFKMMRECFEPYLADPTAFKRTPGQEAKIMLLQMVVFCDDMLDSLVRRGLWAMRFEVSPKLTLLDQKFSHQDVIDWYASSLQLETAQWLSKTIRQATQNKEFAAAKSLPWDYDELGSHVISSLPETVMRQNQSFLELCDHTATKFAFTTSTLFGASYESEIDTLRNRISIEMIESSNRCLILLAEEYQNALISKNWAQTMAAVTGVSAKAGSMKGLKDFSSSSSEEEEANFYFLLSIVNDCGRVVTITKESLREGNLDKANVGSAEKVIKKFEQTLELAIIQIYRVIFADVQDLLLNFKTLWETEVNGVLSKLIYNIESYLEHCKVKLMKPTFLRNITGYCVNAVIGCYLMMIKERALESKKFMGNQMNRIREDISLVRQKFGRYLTDDSIAIGSTPLKSIQLLEDLIDVVTTPFPANPNEILEDVEREPLSKIMFATAMTYPIDIADGVLKDAVYMRGNIEPAVLEVLKKALDEQRNEPKGASTFLEDADLEDFEMVRMCTKIYDKVITKDKKAEKDFFKGLRVGLSDVLSSNQKETAKKNREAMARYLKLLNLKEIDVEERLNDALLRNNSITDRDSEAGLSVKSVLTELNATDTKTITIEVSRIEVRGIISQAFFCQANPYIAITFGDQYVKTPVKWNAKMGAAKWKKTALTVNIQRSKLSRGRMEVQVNDKERVRRKRMLGKVTVNLGGLDLHRIENWFPLRGGEYEGGEVFLSLDISERDTI